jgi:hypothetical protein
MISLGHEYLVDCFDGYFHKAFNHEANKICFDLEGALNRSRSGPY